MIVVDSSALVAGFFDEPKRRVLQLIIDGTDRCLLSAVNAHETACVLRSKFGTSAVAQFWQWLGANRIEIVPFSVESNQAAAAPRNFRRASRAVVDTSAAADTLPSPHASA